jgi:hypothetical protein
MNRTLSTRTFQRFLACAGLVAVCGLMAIAQDSNPAPAQDSTPTPSAVAGQRTDGQIEMDVVHALDASKALKNDLITAATIQGEVTLSGTVSSAASSELAESIAGHVAGVAKVNNNLQVGNPQDAQNAQTTNDPGAQQMADNPPDASTDPVPPPAPDGQAADGQMPAPGQDQGQPPYPQNQGQQPQAQGQQPYPQAQGRYPYPPPRPQYAPGQQPQYQQGPPSGPSFRPATGPVTILPGTVLQVRTNEAVGTKRAKAGETLDFTVIRDVAVQGVLAIPRGATVHGVVTESKKAGDLGGSPVLALKLTSLDLDGQNYPLDSDQFKVKGPNKAGQTVGSAVGGGIVGTIIGCAVGRGVGCAVGAGAGVAAGTAASAASSGPGVWIPAEALVTFRTTTPITVQPVSPQEASRLAQGLYQGGPSLYRRGYYPPYGAAYYGGYPYGYPPVYYRPYFVTGGYYYWR